ncbi:MAG: outer membrane protein assembly factor BamA [FCB group bacterium]|jgi:outer membrane protein insertion porin family
MYLKPNRIIFFILFLVLIYQTSYSQQPGENKSYLIASITVEGNKFSDAATIAALSGLRVGDMLKLPGDTKLNTAMKNLWQRKQFSDVEINVDKITSLGVFLIIKVKEFTRLSQIIIEGEKELSKEDLIKAIGKSRGDIITPYDIYLAKMEIKKKYSKEGLIFAKIDATLEPTDTAYYSKLVLSIKEGVEFHTTSIQFEGNHDFSNSDLAGSFKETHTKHWWEFWRSSKFDLKEYSDDKELLKTFFKKNGYIDANIIKDTLIYDDKNAEVHINIKVSEGTKYYIRNVSFEGNTIFPSEKLLYRLDFKKGNIYDQERFDKNLNGNEDQTDALSLYVDNGYMAIRFMPEETRIAPDSIDVKIKVYENQRVKIRKVEITGNTKTKDKVIRRELYTRPGDFFDRSAVIRSIRALGVLNYFNPESLTKPEFKPIDESNVDIVYKVEERSTDMVNASIGFAGSFGLTGSVGLTLNNFALDEPLYGGGGQIFNITAEFGQASRYQTFAIGLTEPWLFDEPTTVGFNLYYRDINYNYFQKTYGVSTNIGRRFRWPDDYFRGDWNLVIQQNQADSSYYYKPGKHLEITLGQTFSRISYNNIFFPTVGSRFSFTTQFSMGVLGLGTTDFFKNELKFEIVHPLMQINGNDRMVLYMSSYMGYITGFKSDTTIPPIDLYRMGGNGLSAIGTIPLRGYDDQSVGPYNGGQLMSKYVAELRFAISLDPMPVYVYAFAEAGNVWQSLKGADPFDLKRSAGLGVMLSINPIGVVGFSYGYGFDPVTPGGTRVGWKFLFHLGQQ